MNFETVNFTLTSSNILSQIYNHIQIPKNTPKCVICHNKKHSEQFQLKHGFKNPIQQPQVEVFLCNFCQKISEPKCQHCFKSNTCCNYSQKIKYQEFYSNTKKQCLKIATSISNIFKSFSTLSSKDIGFQNKDCPTMSSITNQILIMIAKIQKEYSNDIEAKILQNNKNLHKIYKAYEDSIKNRFFNQTTKSKYENFTLQELYKFSRQIQKDKNDLQFQGSKVCQQYILSVSQNYRKILYSKIVKQLRFILIPQINQKDALVQTLPISANISLKTSSQNYSQNQLNQKVTSLQNIIKKNLQTVSTLNDRIKDLEFIISLEQQKNQQNQMKILQLQAKCGFIKGDDSIQQSFQDSKERVDEKWKGKKVQKVLHRSQIFRSRLKQSRSATNLLTYTHLSEMQVTDTNYEQNYLHLDSSMQKN